MPNIDNLKKFKNVHMIGIGGVSMSGIAAILKNWGFNITGSDWSKSENTEKLEEQGIHVEKGIFGAHMEVSIKNNGPVTIILEK